MTCLLTLINTNKNILDHAQTLNQWIKRLTNPFALGVSAWYITYVSYTRNIWLKRIKRHEECVCTSCQPRIVKLQWKAMLMILKRPTFIKDDLLKQSCVYGTLEYLYMACNMCTHTFYCRKPLRRLNDDENRPKLH